jgi:hypothetical protein
MSNEQAVDGAVVANVKRGRPRLYPYPSTLTCTVTKKVVKTNPSQMKKQIAASGLTMEEYIASYVCRSARSQMKKGTLAADGSVVAAADGAVSKRKGRPKGSKNRTKAEDAKVDVAAEAPVAESTPEDGAAVVADSATV